VRSVSSVSLQLLRSIEEMLLKGPTHNLIIRTRPEIALYVLNHKRAHLRELEERFRVTLTVNADEEVGGQTGFVIDRGEQVMTLEQAKALLAQHAESSPALLEEEEPPLAEPFEEEIEAGEGEHAEPPEHISEVGEEAEPAHAEGGHENGRDGGRGRKRRRRRGRGGRGGEGREGGPYQEPRREPSAFEPGEFAPEAARDFSQPAGEPTPGEAAPEQGFGRAEGDEHQANGNGEHRRKRRGRRGGRRNRRGREPNGDVAVAQGFDTHERPDYNERPERPPLEARHEPDTAEPSYTPRIETAPPPTESQPAAAAAPPESPRRRSTVREPAPVFSGGGTAVATPQLSPQPPPAPVATGTAEDAAKPKRSGWWAKKLLGGD
jgi:ribonuclease E